MTAGMVEKIQVILQAMTAGFTKGLGNTQKHLKSVGKNMQEFGNVMSKPKEALIDMNKNFKVMKTSGGRAAMSIRRLTHGMKGFRMEALGVMFFGMMLQRMFMGFLQPVMEAFGVFDIFRLMLLTLFLPVMEMIFPYFLKIMEWFINLPSGVKKAIGIFVILGVIFATIIMVLAQFALGIGSLILFFPIFGAAVEAVGAFLVGLSAIAVAVIAVIIAIIIGMYVAWKENFMGMKGFVSDFWENFKGVFTAIYDFFKGIIELIVAIFKGDWDGAWEAVKSIFGAAISFIKNLFFGFLNFSAMIAIGVIRVFKWVVDNIVGFFVWLYNKLVGHSIIPDMIKAIIMWFWKLPIEVFEMLESIVSKMFTVGANIIKGMINGIKSLGRKVLDAILSLFPAWMRKGIETSGKITISVIQSIKEKFTGGSGRGGRKDDFIWRAGQGAQSINPNDNLVGFKGAPPNLGGGSGTSNITNNFYGFSTNDLKRELDDRDRMLIEKIRRNE